MLDARGEPNRNKHLQSLPPDDRTHARAHIHPATMEGQYHDEYEQDQGGVRDRLPSFAEVLSRRTKPPVDLYML